MLRTRVWRKGRLAAEDVPVGEISDLVHRRDTVVWVDVAEASVGDFEVLAEELGFHPLAVEDATGRAQRPKFEVYEGHYFLVTYGVEVSPRGDVFAHEIDVFFDQRWMVTVRKGDPWPIDRLLARWDTRDDIGRCGTGRLLHDLLDLVVDSHLQVAEAMTDDVEALEDALSTSEGGASRRLLADTHDLRRALASLRRVVAPMPEVVATLASDRLDLIDDALDPYYRDVLDHAVRASDRIEAQREMLGAGLQTYLALQGHRQNEITKQLASWAAILGVATVIAGIYGMNFRLVPGDGSLFGFWFAIGLMAFSAGGLYAYFRRRGWL